MARTKNTGGHARCKPSSSALTTPADSGHQSRLTRTTNKATNDTLVSYAWKNKIPWGSGLKVEVVIPMLPTATSSTRPQGVHKSSNRTPPSIALTKNHDKNPPSLMTPNLSVLSESSKIPQEDSLNYGSLSLENMVLGSDSRAVVADIYAIPCSPSPPPKREQLSVKKKSNSARRRRSGVPTRPRVTVPTLPPEPESKEPTNKSATCSTACSMSISDVQNDSAVERFSVSQQAISSDFQVPVQEHEEAHVIALRTNDVHQALVTMTGAHWTDVSGDSAGGWNASSAKSQLMGVCHEWKAFGKEAEKKGYALVTYARDMQARRYAVRELGKYVEDVAISIANKGCHYRSYLRSHGQNINHCMNDINTSVEKIKEFVGKLMGDDKEMDDDLRLPETELRKYLLPHLVATLNTLWNTGEVVIADHMFDMCRARMLRQISAWILDLCPLLCMILDYQRAVYEQYLLASRTKIAQLDEKVLATKQLEKNIFCFNDVVQEQIDSLGGKRVQRSPAIAVPIVAPTTAPNPEQSLFSETESPQTTKTSEKQHKLSADNERCASSTEENIHIKPFETSLTNTLEKAPGLREGQEQQNEDVVGKSLGKTTAAPELSSLSCERLPDKETAREYHDVEMSEASPHLKTIHDQLSAGIAEEQPSDVKPAQRNPEIPTTTKSLQLTVTEELPPQKAAEECPNTPTSEGPRKRRRLSPPHEVESEPTEIDQEQSVSICHNQRKDTTALIVSKQDENFDRDVTTVVAISAIATELEPTSTGKIDVERGDKKEENASKTAADEAKSDNLNGSNGNSMEYDRVFKSNDVEEQASTPNQQSCTTTSTLTRPSSSHIGVDRVPFDLAKPEWIVLRELLKPHSPPFSTTLVQEAASELRQTEAIVREAIAALTLGTRKYCKSRNQPCPPWANLVPELFFDG